MLFSPFVFKLIHSFRFFFPFVFKSMVLFWFEPMIKLENCILILFYLSFFILKFFHFFKESIHVFFSNSLPVLPPLSLIQIFVPTIAASVLYVDISNLFFMTNKAEFFSNY